MYMAKDLIMNTIFPPDKLLLWQLQDQVKAKVPESAN